MDQLEGESNASKLVIMCSAMIPKVTAAVKEDEELKNRKRRKDDARDHAHGNMRDVKVLVKAC